MIRVHSRDWAEIAALFAIVLYFWIWLYIRSDVIFEREPNGEFYDPILPIGFVFALSGLSISLYIEVGFAACMRLIEDGGSVSLKRDSVRTIYEHIAKNRRRSSTQGALLVGGIVFVIMASLYYTDFLNGYFGGYFMNRVDPLIVCPDWSNVSIHSREYSRFGYLACPLVAENLVGQTMLAATIGHRLGAVLACGRVFAYFRRRGAIFFLLPAHPDGVAGTAGFGNYFMYLAFLNLSVSIYILIIILAIFTLWLERYDVWLLLNFPLLFISSTYLILGIYYPFRCLADDYSKARQKIVEEHTDFIRQDLLLLKNRLKITDNPKERIVLYKEAAERVEELHLFEGLPRWPVGSIGKRIIAPSALVPFILPLAAFALERIDLVHLIEPLVKPLLKVVGGG